MTSTRATYTKGNPGRHEEQPLHLRSDCYNDYEVESGMAQRVNCLVGFTVVSILLGAAALTLSVLLLFQAFEVSAREEADLAALSQRLRQLEREVGLADSTENIIYMGPAGDHVPEDTPLLKAAGPPEKMEPSEVEVEPVAGEELPVNVEHPHHRNEEVTVGEEHPYTENNGGEETRHMLPPAVSDDEESELEGSGECPHYPRPVCPRNKTICNDRNAEGCPVPVCC
ncbi:uncharacterized protein [Procambarus clarkii]|uniref:uncharacterized protein isoform X1 n=1 Tax=Procambarus clarkii TaxID=6728 RepID=UPI0037429777